MQLKLTTPVAFHSPSTKFVSRFAVSAARRVRREAEKVKIVYNLEGRRKEGEKKRETRYFYLLQSSTKLLPTAFCADFGSHKSVLRLSRLASLISSFLLPLFFCCAPFFHRFLSPFFFLYPRPQSCLSRPKGGKFSGLLRGHSFRLGQ